LWNFEIIKTTAGGFNIIQPALISSNGKGIKDIFEYYLITDNATITPPDDPSDFTAEGSE
jgi:hypothetical protein